MDPYMVLYGVIFIGTLIACRYAVNWADRTDELPALPIPARPDPYELAYLRGGKSAVERLAILELLEGGFLRVGRQEASFWRSRPARTILERAREGQGLPWHLNAALRRFSTPQAVEEMNDLWGDQWAPLQAELEEQLRKEQLLVPKRVEYAGGIATVTSLIVLVPLSVPVLHVVSTWFSNGVGFFLWLSIMYILGACKPGRLSKRGEAYLAQLQETCRGKPAERLPPGAVAAGVTLTLAVEFALVGSECLADTPYETLGDAFDSGDSGDGGDGGGDD